MSTPEEAPGRQRPGALPNLIVIGGMKCGTSALHRYLGSHPDIAMSTPKELCFFYGEQDRGWLAGNWWRGVGWYRSHFPPASPVRGESSPGYTSPAHPGVAARMAAIVPRARLLMLVRDPVERAVSQYRHHRAEGSERRAPAEALLDEGSQYLGRGRYARALEPFLERFPREQLLVVTSEELLERRRATLARIFSFAGVAADHWADELAVRHHLARSPEPDLEAALLARLRAALRPDAERLRALLDRDLPGWTV